MLGGVYSHYLVSPQWGRSLSGNETISNKACRGLHTWMETDCPLERTVSRSLLTLTAEQRQQSDASPKIGSIWGNSQRKDSSSTFDAWEEASSWGAEALTRQVEKAALGFWGMRPKSGRTERALCFGFTTAQHEAGSCVSQMILCASEHLWLWVPSSLWTERASLLNFRCSHSNFYSGPTFPKRMLFLFKKVSKINLKDNFLTTWNLLSM